MLVLKSADFGGPSTLDRAPIWAGVLLASSGGTQCRELHPDSRRAFPNKLLRADIEATPALVYRLPKWKESSKHAIL